MLLSVSGTSESAWFAGSHGRNEREAAFLAALRKEAATWSLPHVEPTETGCEEYLTPLYVFVEVSPGEKIDRDSPAALPWTLALELAFWTDAAYPDLLEGSWGDANRPFDGGPAGDQREDLRVSGVSISPSLAGQLAASWVRTQLGRSLVREDWIRGDEVLASRWSFSDTGRELTRRGISWRRLRGAPADRQVSLR